MLLLPNGCSCSEPSVFPKNWKTVSASVNKKVNGQTVNIKWRIQYYFKDPEHIDRYPNGKLVVVKRMNRYTNLEERREVTKLLLDEEIKQLRFGYNPIQGTTILLPEITNYEIEPTTPFIKALRLAFKKLKLSKDSLACISSSITYIEKSSNRLGYSNIEISRISRKHVIAILEGCNLSAQSYNHYRAYLMQLFTELIRLEAMEINPVDKYVQKRDVEENLRELFSHEERRIILEFYKDDKYFTRFLQIFFHSGSRPVELFRITKDKVDPEFRFFKTKVRKRKKIVEEKRPIKKNAVEFWREVFNETRPGEYLFGRLLIPGPKQCLRDYVTKKWKKEVKNGLGINKDLYALKHTNLDETSAILNAEAAAKQAGHKSTVITMKHYLVHEKDREMERLRNVANKFA